jgi:plasmid stabilization system protein ParE
LAKKIVWSTEAASDLLNILDYWEVRLGSRKYSKKLAEDFFDILDAIVVFPESGRQIPDNEIRVLTKDYYQLYYRIIEENIRLLHIWDCRRDPKDLKL